MENKEKKCPHCQAALDDDSIFCVECGNTINPADSEEITVINLQPQIAMTKPSEPEHVTIKTVEPIPPPIAESFQSHPPSIPQQGLSGTNQSIISALSTRYQDGYRVAKTIEGFGNFLKIVGLVLGGLIIAFGFISGSLVAAMVGNAGGGGAFIGLFFIYGIIGAIIALIFWVLGVIVSAQGQMLKANFDSAVNSSPFLENTDRARIMSLPNI